ncbi:MAG TPA: hypothetical protein VMI11_10085 [Actinomycetes bacterium]|nr:hypothetical protein [Actinomycetes bacterium]
MRTARLGTSGDAGSIVIGWLTRIVLVAAVVGVVGYDAVSIGQGRVSTADEADQVAQDAHDTWSDTHSVDKAYTKARDEVAAHGDSIPPGGFSIQPTTGLVTVKVTHTVDTVLVKRFSFSRGWATMTATGQAQDQT